MLHALGTSNPFHFVRDGVASLLLLLRAEDTELGTELGAREFLVPDTRQWRAWTAELRLDVPLRGASTSHIRYVAPRAHVLVGAGTAIRFVD